MKKKQGHYCKICGTHKANEKFSGKGHANHICKACSAMPVAKRNELQIINRIENIICNNFFLSKEKIKTLENYAKDSRYPEASEFAKSSLDEFYSRMKQYNEDNEEEEVFLKAIAYSELDTEMTSIIKDTLREYVIEFIVEVGYIPTTKDKSIILDEVCEISSETYNEDCYEDELCEIVHDDALRNIYDGILQQAIKDLKAENIEVMTYLQTLTVVTTERLIIRKFIFDDLVQLYNIMSKESVMYAWEHSFTKKETKKWINQQMSRYKKDGYGYFALVSKETEKIIGQVGFMKSTIGGEDVTEIGYIIDDEHWRKGYAYEASIAYGNRLKNCQ